MRNGKLLKYLAALLVLCLALVEFFYHWHSGHGPHSVAQPDAQGQPSSPRELLRQHRHHH